MNKVHAQKIIRVLTTTWMESPEAIDNLYYVEGQHYGIRPTLDVTTFEVGDWLVKWDNGVISAVTAKTFAEHYHQIAEYTYETKYQPLFSRLRVKDTAVGSLHEGRA